MDKHRTLDVTFGSLIKIVVVVALAGLLWYLRDLVLILLTAVVIASSVEPATLALRRLKIPRVFAVLVVYLVFIGMFAGIIYAFIPPLLSETSGLLETMPSVTKALASSPSLMQFLPENVPLGDVTGALNQFIAQYSDNAFALVNVIFGGVFTFILILVFSFYFAVQERGIENFIRVVVPRSNEAYVVDLWKRSQRKIGLWMQGQLLLAVIMGALTYLGLTILGIKYALVLAVLAGLFELIPVFGPTLAAVPAVALAFVTGGMTTALIVVALYVILQQFENHLIYPLVVTKVVGVPPLMVIMALLIGAQLAGFLGILLSVPMAAVVQEIVADLDKWKHEQA